MAKAYKIFRNIVLNKILKYLKLYLWHNKICDLLILSNARKEIPMTIYRLEVKTGI